MGYIIVTERFTPSVDHLHRWSVIGTLFYSSPCTRLARAYYHNVSIGIKRKCLKHGYGYMAICDAVNSNVSFLTGSCLTGTPGGWITMLCYVRVKDCKWLVVIETFIEINSLINFRLVFVIIAPNEPLKVCVYCVCFLL